MNLTRTFARIALASGFAVTGLVALPNAAKFAHAADSCGSNYSKQSDGAVSASDSASSSGRTVKTSFSGKVRFCSRERLGLNQKNQRVVVSVPDRIVAEGRFSGNGVVKVCLELSITVHGKHISSGTSIGVSGLTPGFTKNHGSSSVTVSSTTCSTQPTTLLKINSADTAFTVPNCSFPCFADPAISKVVVSTTVSMTYRSGSTQTKLVETAQDTDLPN